MMKKSIISILCLSLLITGGCSPLSFLKGNNSESESTPEASVSATLTITQGTGEVFPYRDEIKMYLEAGASANVADYLFTTNNQALGIQLAWECNETVDGYILRYGIKDCADSEVTEVTLDADETEYELYNLYKDTQYDWSVSAVIGGDVAATKSESFTTTDLGPRVLHIDSVYNTRDAGGYLTEEGKKTKQGLLYRGGEIPAYLRESDKKCFVDTMGIKTELDLRGYTEESGYRDESPIPGATIKHVVTDGYMGAYRLAENFRQVFSLMADESNYPMYVHCTGGADRTGTVIFLVNALLGVPEAQLVQDYEFTSFSRYGERNSMAGTTYGDMFQEFLMTLKSYEGETLAQKTESYMLSIGVKQAEIDQIRTIMIDA